MLETIRGAMDLSDDAATALRGVADEYKLSFDPGTTV